MRVVGIIQARMRSTRLPGKILKVIEGKTVLEHDIIRLRAASLVDEVVVATGTDPANDPVADEAARVGVRVVRGPEDDVLARYQLAASESEAEVIVRMTSDCPLFDPRLLDRMLDEFLTSQQGIDPFDYYSNTWGGRTYPVGLDAEIFTRQALKRAFAEGKRPAEREHVTPYLHQNPQLFHIGFMSDRVDNSHHRWTLDTPEDLEFIEQVYAEVYAPDRLFTTEDVYALLERRPELSLINSEVHHKAIDPEIKGGLVIRCDLSPAIGAGHFMRCLALAQAWPRERGPVTFAMAEGGERVEDRLQEAGFALRPVRAEVSSPEDAATTAGIIAETGAEWMILDGYRFDADYMLQHTGQACRLLVIDDDGRRDLPPVDALLNQNLHASEDRYPGRASTTKLLLGLEHQLLRREFLDAPRREGPVAEIARRILITLGGGDPRNVTGRLLGLLADLPGEDLQIRVLVGGDKDRLGQLGETSQDHPHAVELLSTVRDMPTQYQWPDLAICGGGGTLWELAYLGVPAATFILADNQEPSSLLMHERGVVHGLGRPEENSDDDLRREIADLLNSPERRAALSAAGRDLVDGQGADRVVAKLVAWSRKAAS